MSRTASASNVVTSVAPSSHAAGYLGFDAALPMGKRPKQFDTAKTVMVAQT